MSLVKKLVIVNVAAFFCFALDRILKWIFVQGNELTVIEGFLKFKLLENEGIAFGLPFANWIFYIIVGIILLVLFYFLIKFYRNKKLFSVGALTFVIFGAISNIVDRVRYQHVVDYITVWNWSVFNVADIMIVLAVLAYFIRAFSKKQEKKLTGE